MSIILRSTASLNWRAVADNPSRIIRYFGNARQTPVSMRYARPGVRVVWPATRLAGEAILILGRPYPVESRIANPSGSAKRFAFTGVTYDTNGAVLAGATVNAFRTSDNSFQEQATSDPTGAYVVTSPYNDGHFITVKKTGSPNVAGITDDNLTGT
jgi:hypothetical protein